MSDHQSTPVVGEELKTIGKYNSKLAKQLARPESELARSHYRQELRLTRAERHAVLQLGLMTHHVAEEEEAESSPRAPRVWISGVVGSFPGERVNRRTASLFVCT